MDDTQEEMRRRTVLDMFNLTGKVALVTGGASLLGRQIVEALAETGARIFMASRDLDKLQKQADVFRVAGFDVAALQYDQGCEHSCEKLLQQIVGIAGGVDILVNNAMLRPMRDWSSPTALFAKSMEINATGLFVMLRTFGEHMALRGQGSIINIGSIHGAVGPDFTLYEGLDWSAQPDYSFHKGGLMQLTRFAASKLGPRGVRINAIMPGGFFNNQETEFVARYSARTFLGRMGNKTDLKGAIVFLASEASAYVTGAAIAVDAGYTAK